MTRETSSNMHYKLIPLPNAGVYCTSRQKISDPFNTGGLFWNLLCFYLTLEYFLKCIVRRKNVTEKLLTKPYLEQEFDQL